MLVAYGTTYVTLLRGSYRSSNSGTGLLTVACRPWLSDEEWACDRDDVTPDNLEQPARCFPLFAIPPTRVHATATTLTY
eukprot:COSAG05_NODE_5173_length_1245_cov_1.040140_2_plen_79_part_00